VQFWHEHGTAIDMASAILISRLLHAKFKVVQINKKGGEFAFR
jgi:hypothetical protein